MKPNNPRISLAFRFHVNFYHSYRGDSLDERGIGKDIRIIRGILDSLDKLNDEGIPVRGTWDIENYYSLELYMPKHAPDILERIKGRVSAGMDEVELMSYNNGLIPAHDREEAVRAVAWAITNPAGSGLKDVFGTWAPIVRPQECMITPSNIADYRACGVEAVSIYYSAIPFNGFGSFVPPLHFASRYNPLCLRMDGEENTITLLPAYNHGDIVERGFSLRRWLLSLRRKQIAMKTPEDLILLIDMDADDFFWEGMPLPLVPRFFPSFAGLESLAKSVADLPFIDFALPWEYLKSHPAREEVSFGQDCADGSWDGFSSWAEKRENLEVWPIIDRARRLSSSAHQLASGQKDPEIEKILDEGLTERVLALSTTHFGMASPVMNEERLACAFQIAKKAGESGLSALNRARKLAPTGIAPNLRLLDPEIETLAEGRGSLLFLDDDDDGDGLEAFLLGTSNPAAPKRYLVNPLGSELHAQSQFVKSTAPLQLVSFSEAEGYISNGSLRLEVSGTELSLLSDSGFRCAIKSPAVVYGKRQLKSKKTENVRFWTSSEERAAELTETGVIVFPSGEKAEWRRVFTLAAGLPYLYMDCEITYPVTRHTGYSTAKASRLGRSWDAKWKEVLPCELVPEIGADAEKPMRVWKHNFEDRVSSFAVDYHRYSRNRNIPSINNQITDGWVAFSRDGDARDKRGILLAQSASKQTSFAFCPIRTRLARGIQEVRLNPFGTYAGPQLHYPTAGNGLGRIVSTKMGNQYDPYAPAWAGGALSFRMMLAPYDGSSPPEGLQRDALVFASLPVKV